MSDKLRNRLSQSLNDLTTNQKLKEEQIVILGTHHLHNTSLSVDPIIGKFTIIENDPPSKNHIPNYSCMKYKRLESDVVILLDYQDVQWDVKSIKYTGISRVKHLLFILSIKK